MVARLGKEKVKEDLIPASSYSKAVERMAKPNMPVCGQVTQQGATAKNYSLGGSVQTSRKAF